MGYCCNCCSDFTRILVAKGVKFLLSKGDDLVDATKGIVKNFKLNSFDKGAKAIKKSVVIGENTERVRGCTCIECRFL